MELSGKLFKYARKRLGLVWYAKYFIIHAPNPSKVVYFALRFRENNNTGYKDQSDILLISTDIWNVISIDILLPKLFKIYAFFGK